MHHLRMSPSGRSVSLPDLSLDLFGHIATGGTIPACSNLDTLEAAELDAVEVDQPAATTAKVDINAHIPGTGGVVPVVVVAVQVQQPSGAWGSKGVVWTNLGSSSVAERNHITIPTANSSQGKRVRYSVSVARTTGSMVVPAGTADGANCDGASIHARISFRPAVA